jgi:hypothetical protein
VGGESQADSYSLKTTALPAIKAYYKDSLRIAWPIEQDRHT